MRRSLPRSRFRRNNWPQGSAIEGQGYPVILHWGTLVIILGLLIFAAFKQMAPLLAATVFLLLLTLLPRLWSHYAIRGLAARLTANPDHAFPDEEVSIDLEVLNRGLSIPWLEAEVELPYRLVKGKNPASPFSCARASCVTALSRGQRINWPHVLKAGARGNYQLGPVRLTAGDLSGLFPKELVLPQSASLLVYPRLLPLAELKLPLKALLGEKIAPRQIYEDTSRVAGAREYHFGDAFKRIHWKASAAHDRLQTRQYDSSSSLNLLLIFDAHEFQPDDDFEYAVSVVATLAYQAASHGFAVGLMLNADPEVWIPIGSGQNQLFEILEALARFNAGSPTPLARQIDRFRTFFPVGVTLALVSRTAAPANTGLAAQMERSGYSVHCIATGQGSPEVSTTRRQVRS